MSLVAVAEADYVTVPLDMEDPAEDLTTEQRDKFLRDLEENMREAAKKFDFEKAAQIRDRIKTLKAGASYDDIGSRRSG
jgi:excinuclease ABC subunit B